MAVRGMEEAIILMLRKSGAKSLYFMTVELIKMVNISSKGTLNSSTYHIYMHNKKKSRWDEDFDNICWLRSGKCKLKT